MEMQAGLAVIMGRSFARMLLMKALLQRKITHRPFQ